MARSGSIQRCSSWIAAALIALFVALVPVESALAQVVAHVNLTSQRMDVVVNGRHYASWTISSGRKGKRTPTGSYRPTMLRKMHYSSIYDNAPMPHSIFFHHGYAIHGTEHIRRLGQPASGGCVRLHPRHAAQLYQLVRQHGRANTRIHIKY
jgi:lipoprotein-anchoring transpeptidase ErfK/SrfK